MPRLIGESAAPMMGPPVNVGCARNTSRWVMGLTADQSQRVRSAIAKVLAVDPARVLPEAKIFGDLGAEPGHLKPLQVATEEAVGVSVEPVIQQINTRVALGSDGLLTATSLQQIAEYLGPQALIPSSPANYVAIFTVGYIEAMAAKALAPPPTTKNWPGHSRRKP